MESAYVTSHLNTQAAMKVWAMNIRAGILAGLVFMMGVALLPAHTYADGDAVEMIGDITCLSDEPPASCATVVSGGDHLGYHHFRGNAALGHVEPSNVRFSSVFDEFAGEHTLTDFEAYLYPISGKAWVALWWDDETDPYCCKLVSDFDPNWFAPGNVTAIDDETGTYTHYYQIDLPSATIWKWVSFGKYEPLWTLAEGEVISFTMGWNNRRPGPLGPLEATAGDALVDLRWPAPNIAPMWWSNGGSRITLYRIYRGTTSGELDLLVEVSPDSFGGGSYTDTDVTNNVTYYYSVSAVNEVGEGPLLLEVFATPKPKPPPEPRPDTENPTVAINSLADGATLDLTTVSVSGTSSDNVVVEKVELSRDCKNWVPATGTTSWSGTLTPDEGPNTICARATDASGNSETVSIEVIFDKVIVILRPPQEIQVIGRQAPLSVEATYAYSQRPFQGEVRLNDTLVKDEPGTYGYTVSHVEDHIFGLSVFSVNSVSVRFEVPSLELEVPSECPVGDELRAHATARFSDGTLLRGATVAFSLNGEELARGLANSDGTASATIALNEPGEQAIRAVLLGMDGGIITSSEASVLVLDEAANVLPIWPHLVAYTSLAVVAGLALLYSFLRFRRKT